MKRLVGRYDTCSFVCWFVFKTWKVLATFVALAFTSAFNDV